MTQEDNILVTCFIFNSIFFLLILGHAECNNKSSVL